MNEQDKEQPITDPQSVLPTEPIPKDADFTIAGEARVWKGMFGTIAKSRVIRCRKTN